MNSAADFGTVLLVDGANTLQPVVLANQGSVNTINIDNLELQSLIDAGGTLNIASAVGLLPTGRSTLRQHTDGDYALFIDALLENATLPLDDSVGGAAARAMQSALLSVIAGESSAVQAANDVVGAAPIG